MVVGSCIPRDADRMKMDQFFRDIDIEVLATCFIVMASVWTKVTRILG